MSYGLGIDLGASFVKAAVSRGDRAQMTALSEHSVLMPSAAPALALREAAATVASGEGEPPHRTVLTHPAAWDPARREQFTRAAYEAGLERVTVVTGAEAALALHLSRNPRPRGGAIAVYDLGAATLDVAVLRLSDAGRAAHPLITGTPVTLDGVGGDSFDQAVLDHVVRIAGRPDDLAGPADLVDRIRTDCTRAKERLSTEEWTTVTVLLPGRTAEVRLTRTELEALIRPALDRTLDALHECLRSAGLAAAGLAGVLLVGGSSRVPLVGRLLREAGFVVLAGADPQHANAFGAAGIAARDLPAAAPVTPATPAVRSARGAGPRRAVVAAAFVVLAALATGGTYLALDGGDSRGRETSTLSRVSGGTPTTGSVAAPTPFVTPSANAVTGSPVPTRPRAGTGSTGPSGAGRAGPGEQDGPGGQGEPGGGDRTGRADEKPPAATTAAEVVTKKGSGSVKRAPDFEGVVTGPAGKCLDVMNGVSGDATVAQITTCNGTVAQYWTANGTGTIKAMGKCLDATSVRDSPKTAGLGPCDGSDDQSWTVSGRTLVNAGSGKCLSVYEGSTADGTRLLPSRCTAAAGQLWELP